MKTVTTLMLTALLLMSCGKIFTSGDGDEYASHAALTDGATLETSMEIGSLFPGSVLTINISGLISAPRFKTYTRKVSYKMRDFSPSIGSGSKTLLFERYFHLECNDKYRDQLDTSESIVDFTDEREIDRFRMHIGEDIYPLEVVSYSKKKMIARFVVPMTDLPEDWEGKIYLQARQDDNASVAVGRIYDCEKDRSGGKMKDATTRRVYNVSIWGY